MCSMVFYLNQTIKIPKESDIGSGPWEMLLKDSIHWGVSSLLLR